MATRDEGLRLREALLEPGQGRFTQAEFVGRDETSAFAFGLVRDRSGAVVAYVSDGRGIGEWFSGSTEDGRLALPGDEGGRLEGAIARGGVEGKAEVADQSIGFTLGAADRGAGLRRLVGSVSDREIECGFVICNAGAIYGVGKTGDTVAFSYRVESDEIPDGDSVTPGEGVDSEEPEPRRFLGQLRCAILLLKYSRCDNDLLYGGGQCSNEQLQQLSDRFAELDCPNLGWSLP